MSADPFYEVTGDNDAPIGTHDCFSQAEQRARWYAARYSKRYRILRVTPTRKGNQYESVATVIRDALGRVWTDVQSTDGLI